jgi:DNA-binding LacI/PurR family transcriptional regulator
MASLKDIAERANVTSATVSRALRGHPNVTPETAERIREIAQALGYTHNLRISNLMSYVRSSCKTRFRENLAFIWLDAEVGEVTNTYQLQRFERGAIERARHLGYGMDVFYYDPKERKRWSKLHKILQARNIRGLVWGPVLRSSHVHLTMPIQAYACAGIGEAFVYPRLPHARFDHFVGMRTALHQLKREGCRRVAFALGFWLNVRAAPILIASFVTSAARGTFKSKELLYTPDVLKRADLVAWLVETKPDAVLLSNDMPELADLPRHPQITWPMRMASLNHLSETPPFSGIDQRQDLIASHACDLVVEQLGRNEFGAPKHTKVVMVEGEWKSIDCPRDATASRSKAAAVASR